MVNSPNQAEFQFSWPDILWRLLVTILLLLALAGFGLTTVDPMSLTPDVQVLPTINSELGIE